LCLCLMQNFLAHVTMCYSVSLIPATTRTYSLRLHEVEVEVEVNLRPTASRPVCLGVELPSGAHD
jgi:hypothetical protein